MASMAPIRLPLVSQDICRLGFGCEALGGFNWGDVNIYAIEEAIVDALHGARQIRQAVLFDTSDTYGPLLSEERLGRVLESAGDSAVIASKFGVRLQDGKAWYDTSAAWADQALDGSLSRLRRTHIDLYQLHWPDQTTPLADTLKALEGFRAEGRISAYGVCNVPPADLLPLVQDFPGLVSFSQSYSLIDRVDRGAIQTLCDAGLIFVAYGCLAQGLLTGKYNKDTSFGDNDRRRSAKYVNFHGDRLAQNLKVVEALRTQAARLGKPVPTLALQFVLADLPRSITLAGIKSSDQWARNLTALAAPLPGDVHLALQECSRETAL